MTDFMPWLYANYIKPQISSAPKEDYASHFDALRNELSPGPQADLEKCLEFASIRAFLLGIRTGAGLVNAR